MTLSEASPIVASSLTPRSAAVSVVIAGVLLGTAGTAGSYAPGSATPIGIGGLRLLAGALALTALLPRVGGRIGNLPSLFRRPAIWVMAAGSGAYQLCFFGAVQRSGVAISTLVAVGAAPVFTGLVAWVALHHRPRAAWAIATALAIVGLTLRSWHDLTIDDAIGLCMAAGAGLCAACYVVAAKHEMNRGGHVIEVPAAAYLLGSLLISPLVLMQPLHWATSGRGVLVVLYLGLATMAIANAFQVRGITGLQPGPTATLMLTDPLTATVLGVVILDEHIDLLGALGCVLVLVALVAQARALAPDGDELEPPPVL